MKGTIEDLESRIAELEEKLSGLLGPASSPAVISIPAGGIQTVGAEKTPVTELTVSAKRAIEGTVTVQILKHRPVGLVKVVAPDVAYQYLNVFTKNIAPEDIEKAEIEFKVEKAWITGEEIDVGTITLYRYSTEANEWTSLPTEKVGEDATYIYFKAKSPGLSVFAITGKRVTPFPWTIILAVAIAVILAIVAIRYIRRPR